MPLRSISTQDSSSLSPAVHKSTVMFLSKDQGKRTRLVGDYRKLDAHSEVPPGDLASIGRILRRVPATWTHFCVLDVANGFFSVPLVPSIRHIFGFGFGTDRYQWCVIPRGWCLSSGLFHDRVGRILRDSAALNYADGVIIGGSSEAEFSANMHDVLARFDEHGIQIIRQRKIRLLFFVQSVSRIRSSTPWTHRLHLMHQGRGA